MIAVVSIVMGLGQRHFFCLTVHPSKDYKVPVLASVPGTASLLISVTSDAVTSEREVW